ncbi:Riboflavin transporter MCH5 [Lachnellula suecica]|uniref:Riboflavin transporter MCH5 n=1 Tax=Lachnellula suecica TaxID=602035 RepID=A0A8T9BZ66_9HELO|nr:Riboflavin transporter MCH5 [Lachnellula suecica]
MFPDFKLLPLRDPRSRLSILDYFITPRRPNVRLPPSKSDISLPTLQVNPTSSFDFPSESLSTKTQSNEVEIPEGGRQAWLVVFGSWCALFSSLGIMNTMGAFQEHISKNQLKDLDVALVGWIFSLYAFLTFGVGLFIGPIFDAYGPRYLILSGSVLVILGMYLTGDCRELWQFILCFSVLGGVGSALLFSPSIAIVGHYFNKRRGHATGLATTGGAFGGILYPFIPDIRILARLDFAITVLGVFLLEFALFVPLTYITSYSLAQGFTSSFSYLILPIINLGSVFGRWLPGFIADKWGRFNTAIIAIILTVFAVLDVWLPFGNTKPGLIVFALLFGFASGSNISLTPVCLSQLCDIKHYGRYYSTCFLIVSLGCLTGVPIAGRILDLGGGSYRGLILFVGFCYAGGLVAFLGARILATGLRVRVKY